MVSKNKNILKILFFIGLALSLLAAGIGYNYYQQFFKPNVQPTKPVYLYIASNATFADVLDSLISKNILIDKKSFVSTAKFKKYKKIKGGRYEIKKGMNNNRLINMLRSGNQKPLNLTFNNIRTKAQLAARISTQIEADSSEIFELLNSSTFLKTTPFDENSILSLFIPNTYQVYWNTSAKKLIERMQKEYAVFWTSQRKEKAKEIGLSTIEVSILASIVQAEQSAHSDEKPIIAGLYINRLHKKMLLQSDPTLIYALGNFSIKRVLNEHKEIDSPYNTYKNIGLPPGPILLPEISSIEAVLNYKKHNYIFMCAKEDFSGYHYFSTTNRQHEIYAQRYRTALNKRKVYK